MGIFRQTMIEVYNVFLCGMLFVAVCFLFAVVADWIGGELK